MQRAMNLTENDVERLLDQRPITEEWPWCTEDERAIRRHFKDLIAELRRRLRVRDRTEFAHYGSGYASYVDCFLYRADDDFRSGPGNSYHGLVVLLSRLSPFYAIAEGEKNWRGREGSSYLPDLSRIDRIQHRGPQLIEDGVCRILDDRGMNRVRQDDLAPLLRALHDVPTILGDPPWRLFDALFYWED